MLLGRCVLDHAVRSGSRAPNTVVARRVEIVPLQLHLTLSAVEWQELALSNET